MPWEPPVFNLGRAQVYVVVDGLPAHKKANVRQYLASTQGRLNMHVMHVLPGYAPDKKIPNVRATFGQSSCNLFELKKARASAPSESRSS